jgi:regulator of sigma E protease
MGLLNVAAWLAATVLFIIGPLILIHELGHFLTARRAGVRVEEFGVGYPPRLLTLAGKEGRLTVSGVQVVIPGRFRLPLGLARGERVEAVARREQDGSVRLQRLTLPDRRRRAPSRDEFYKLEVETDAGTEGEPAYDYPPPIEETAEGLVLRGELTEFEPGTQYTLNLIPFGGFVRMTGEEDPSDPRSMAAQPKRWRLAILSAGSVANILAAFVLLTAGYASGHPELFHVQIGGIEENSAAAAAGLQADDIIVGVNGAPVGETVPYESQEQLRGIIEESGGQDLVLTILRDDETLTITAQPSQVDGLGYLGIWMLDVEDSSGVVYHALPRATVLAGQDLVDTFVTIVQLPSLLLQGEVQPSEVQPTSVVGVSEIMTLSLQQSVTLGRPWYALQTAAVISLALGLTNLLPLPALDGGRILFVLIEAIRGRRLRPEVEGAIHFAGMVVLLALFALLMIQDIINPLIPWSFLNQ